MMFTGAGILGILFVLWKAAWIKKQEVGNEKIEKIGKNISEGVITFIKAEYKILTVFILAVGTLLVFKSGTTVGSNGFAAVSFVVGAVLAALAGFIGMKAAIKANTRTTTAAQNSYNQAFKLAFTGGSVMGISVVSLSIIGLASLFGTYMYMGFSGGVQEVLNVISSFALGASSFALFARIGGGIFTKAADMGADMVGKSESGIPEDHILNPAAIADNVGDNVGNGTGSGAEIFESFSGSIIASMVLGALFLNSAEIAESLKLGPILLPLALGASGILVSVISTFFLNIKENGDIEKAIKKVDLISLALMAVVSYFLVDFFLPDTWEVLPEKSSADKIHIYHSWGVFWASMVGLCIGYLMEKITGYYTSAGNSPVNSIVNKSTTGISSTILAGIETGMKSTVMPIILIAGGMVGAYYFAGFYGIAIAAVTMLANSGMKAAIDAFAPIADNADGIAQMSEMSPEVKFRTEKLDEAGTKTAANGKGFSIAAAALTSLALYLAYIQQTGILDINITDPLILASLFIGSMIPFVFSSITLGAVGRAASKIVEEVRRQFREIPALNAAISVLKKYNNNIESATDIEKQIVADAEGTPEYNKCIDISSKASLKEIILPAAIAIVVPVAVGYAAGPELLGALLAGVIGTGVLMSIFQSNAGGALDNAKKTVESGVNIGDSTFGKGSDLYNATVVGDNVGDPLKDTSGPSMNVLMKLMVIVALVIAPSIVCPPDKCEHHDDETTEKNIIIENKDIETTNVDFNSINIDSEKI